MEWFELEEGNASMIRSALVACLIFVSLENICHAQLEGIAFAIADGESPQFNAPLELSKQQKAQFKAFRLESRAELSDVWREMRGSLRQIKSDDDQKKWNADHGPKIQQINYDLWQRACRILQTPERIETYHRILLQHYLHTARDLRIIGALTGVDLTYTQTEELRSKVAKNLSQLDNLLADRRREIEAEKLGPFLDEQTLVQLRGEEFVWDSEPPISKHHPFGPFEEMAPDHTLTRIANHADVLDALAADAKARQTIGKAYDEVGGEKDELDFMRNPNLFGLGKTVEEQQAVQKELMLQKKSAEDEQVARLKTALSNSQFERLLQIAAQLELRAFRYAKALSIAGVEVEKNANRKLQAAAQQAQGEMEFAKMQLAVDLNAKSFDDVAKTNLRTSLGKLVAYSGHHYAYGGLQHQQEKPKTATELFGAKYGSNATTELQIPKSLTKAPKETVEWNNVIVPNGWKLDDAIANLEKRNHIVQQIVDANAKWKQDERDLQLAMINAQKAGDDEAAKLLRVEFMNEFGGPGRFTASRQFREGFEIAKKDVIEARRIVKKLGGDPGQLIELPPFLH